jgi:hypothetical protein
MENYFDVKLLETTFDNIICHAKMHLGTKKGTLSKICMYVPMEWSVVLKVIGVYS